jgi:hypothetical protein
MWKKSEVLFVLAILVVVFSVSFFQLRLGQAKTRDAQRKSDIELVGRALDDYLAQLEVLPEANDQGKSWHVDLKQPKLANGVTVLSRMNSE